MLLLLYKSFLMVTHHGVLMLSYTLVETPPYNYHDKKVLTLTKASMP